jgi:hypothetical protein
MGTARPVLCMNDRKLCKLERGVLGLPQVISEVWGLVRNRLLKWSHYRVQSYKGTKPTMKK